VERQELEPRPRSRSSPIPGSTNGDRAPEQSDPLGIDVDNLDPMSDGRQ
jgi:hypothetical protein